MSKRAAIIITDARYVEWFDQSLGYGYTVTAKSSEQLLADLRRVLDLADGMRHRMLRRPTHFNGYIELEVQERERADGAAVARVRALLPKEDDHE